MRLESCRKCGLEMKPDMRCEICRDYNRLHCPKCDATTEEQVHIHNT